MRFTSSTRRERLGRRHRHPGAILSRMSLPILGPGFKPVTRDLSPTKTDMVLAYLGGLVAQAKPADA